MVFLVVPPLDFVTFWELEEVADDFSDFWVEFFLGFAPEVSPLGLNEREDFPEPIPVDIIGVAEGLGD